MRRSGHGWSGRTEPVAPSGMMAASTARWVGRASPCRCEPASVMHMQVALSGLRPAGQRLAAADPAAQAGEARLEAVRR
jgi:hypothetical protein